VSDWLGDDDPYLPLNIILEGDCVEVLNGLPAQSVDLVFADPPYNLQLRGDLFRPNLTRVDAVDNEWDQFESFAEYDAFTRQWLAACRRVLKENGTLWVIGTYHNIFRVGTALMDTGFWILNDVAWVKHNPMPNMRGTRFTNAHETLIWAQKHKGNPYTFNYHVMKSLNGDKQMRSDWYMPIVRGKARIRINGEKAHPTQKPLELLQRIILACTDPGDTVLDPFFGSGTTGAAAKQLHRNWIGIERDLTYIEVAQRRIDEVEQPPYDPAAFEFTSPRRRPRVSFGTLIERGMIVPGQVLTFTRDESKQATVLANGKLDHDGQTGTIHTLARSIAGAPCNGWEHWLVTDHQTGEAHLLNDYREQIRAELESD